MDKGDGKKVKDWGIYVGHKCIVIEDRYAESAIEVKVLDVSPKGRVKFQFSNDYKEWEDKKDYFLIEDLGEATRCIAQDAVTN